MERFELQPGYSAAKIITGGWQLATGHGPEVSKEDVFARLQAYVEAGFTTFDCGDIYTGVEELLGEFRSRTSTPIQVHTKFVPDFGLLPTLDKEYVESIIDRSLQRLQTEQLDLVQFHWWNFDVPRHIEVAGYLKELQQAGKVKQLGVTNYDTAHLQELTDAGIEIVSNQVQYSLFDRRPQKEMTSFCEQHDIKLLCYGVLAGGFLSSSYLNAPEPGDELKNRSLVKYKLILEDAGGWDTFQRLLATLDGVASKHNVELATVAARYVLEQKQVFGLIIGFSQTREFAKLEEVFSFSFDEEDTQALDGVLQDIPMIPGDIYSVERDKDGRHGKIMKYNLNDDK